MVMIRRWAYFFSVALVLVSVVLTGGCADSRYEELLERAEAGNAFAQGQLGYMYANGQGVRQDDAEAVRWTRLAAEQGNAAAQDNLGNMYTAGQGVPHDYTEAVRWFRLAADQGDVNAQFNLGIAYATGEGVPQDDTEAVRWYRLAADQGDAYAQVNLGYRYLDGEGVPQDLVQAYMWFHLASSRMAGGEREGAVIDRDRVAARMTSDQLAEAQRLAREWDEAHPRD